MAVPFYTKDHLAERAGKEDWSIGDFSYGKPTVVGFEAKLKIGKYCSIADGVRIFLGWEHRTDWVSTYPFSALVERGWSKAEGIKGHPHTKGDVVIGDDVWVASNVTILSGVTIGSGAVIGTGSVVTKDVPPYSVVSGMPAKVKRYRFSDDIIEKLLEVQWWNRSPEQVNEISPLLLSGHPELVIGWLEENKPSEW